MPTTVGRTARRPRPVPAGVSEPTPSPKRRAGTRRIASNFVFLSLAEIACRAVSVFVTLALTERLGRGGYGRIEFGFNVVFWLVLIVRDGFEVIGAREIARHPKLVRPLVNHILAVKLALAAFLYGMLVLASTATLTGPTERGMLRAYGLLLFTTAFGLDFAYRGLERMGLPAISLVVRTCVYAAGVLFVAGNRDALLWVPLWLVIGEAVGIALVWVDYSRRFGIPRPAAGRKFLRVILRRGRPILAICLAQTILTTVDMMVVGLASTWVDSGLYSAPQRLISAVMTLGLVFQQVVFPSLARAWRSDAADTRAALDRIVRFFSMGFIPVAVGASALAGPIVGFLLPSDFGDARWILAVGIWRAPLLTLAFLYQGALIALGRERSATRYLFASAFAAPWAILMGIEVAGLPGGTGAMAVVSAALAVAAYSRLRAEDRAPAYHHHAAKPILASIVMLAAAVPLARLHVLAGVAGGAAVYCSTLLALGGIEPGELRELIRKP